ncbi:MAG: hypothetical protein ACLPXZ_24540 [Mycobacterium sp.]
MALEQSCSSCEACGEAEAPGVELVAGDDDDDDAPDEEVVEELPVVDFCPHPEANSASSAAANTIAIDLECEERREGGRWEICACVIKPFMASLC